MSSTSVGVGLGGGASVPDAATGAVGAAGAAGTPNTSGSVVMSGAAGTAGTPNTSGAAGLAGEATFAPDAPNTPDGAVMPGAQAASENAPLLSVRGLCTWFPIRTGLFRRTTGWVRAVDGVDLDIAKGRTLALVGESGCGKTTVGRSILGLEQARAGEAWYGGEQERVDLLSLSQKQFFPYRRKLTIIFQDPLASLDPRMRVRDLVAEGMNAFRIGRDSAERTERCAELLRRVQLDPDTMWRYPHEFSGGQRQRIGIARALALEPELIICDEAVSALDISIQAQVLNLLGELQQEFGLAYLFITHDLSVVRYLADEVAVMYLGQIVERGATQRVFEAPAHPYTRGLLSALPSVDPMRRQLAVRVLGDVPSPAAPPPGCRFHTRCTERFERCDREAPPMFPTEQGESRCFLCEVQSNV